MIPVRTLLEDDVIGRLEPLLLKRGGYLKGVRPYNGEIHRAQFSEVREQLGAGAPAILLSFDDATDELRGNLVAGAAEDMELSLWLCGTSLRGRAEQLRGGPGGEEPSIYQMLDDTFRLLCGKTPEVGGAPLDGAECYRPVRVRRVGGDPDLTIYQRLFHIRVDLEAAFAYVAELDQVTIRYKLPAPDTTTLVTTTSNPEDD